MNIKTTLGGMREDWNKELILLTTSSSKKMQNLPNYPSKTDEEMMSKKAQNN
jgi:hypothetical protein